MESKKLKNVEIFSSPPDEVSFIPEDPLDFSLRRQGFEFQQVTLITSYEF